MAYSLRREVTYTVWGKEDLAKGLSKWKVLVPESLDFLQASSIAKAFSGTALVISTSYSRELQLVERWDHGVYFQHFSYLRDELVQDSFDLEETRELFLRRLVQLRKKGWIVIDLWGPGNGRPCRLGWVIRDPSDEPSTQTLNRMIHPGVWLSENFGKFIEGVSPKHKMNQREVEMFVRGRAMEGSATMSASWAKMGIPYVHGMCVYLLGYTFPWSKEVRETEHGWVDPFKWATHNFDRFKEHLPEIDYKDPNVLLHF